MNLIFVYSNFFLQIISRITMKCWPPKTSNIAPVNLGLKCFPWCLTGPMFFNLCPFPEPSEYMAHNLVSIGPAVWPFSPAFRTNPKMPSLNLEGLIVFSLWHSQMNYQTCTKFGANWSSHFGRFPILLYFWPPKARFSEKTRWDQMEKMATWFFMFTIIFRIF